MQWDGWVLPGWEIGHTMATIENINIVLSANSHWDDLGWSWSQSYEHCTVEIFCFSK